jgi:hypothetical protein
MASAQTTSAPAGLVQSPAATTGTIVLDMTSAWRMFHVVKTALAQGGGGSPEALLQQTLRTGDSTIPKDGAGEQFGWGVSYYAGNFVRGYQRTKDTAWLDAAQRLSEYCLSKMRTGPDGYKGWVGEDQTGRGLWADNHVGDAIEIEPMLEFAEVVLKDPELKKKYGEAAQTYVDVARRDLFEKWDRRGTWKEDGAWGCYVGWNMVCTQADPNAWKKDTAPAIAEPFNKNNHMGICALRLFRVTGEEKWRERAFKIFAYTKVFDLPYYHNCKSLTVAAVMPNIVKKGASTIILCKARIPQDPFEIALYSADGKDKVLVIHQGKIDGGLDGHAGIFIAQWDPASSKDKPLRGAYRIRWTGVDGYREFPITVTE